MLRIYLPWQKEKRRARQAAIAAYSPLMRAALSRSLYENGAVPDTFEGRAGMVTAHAAVMIARLAEAGTPEAARLVDALDEQILDGFDAAYRERGVGDASIARKVRKLAEGYSGAGRALVVALAVPDQPGVAVADVLVRNGYVSAGSAERVADRLVRCLRDFREQTDTDILAGKFNWPDR